jgi:glycosyltransferase involved in cell wall biosynthesis
LVDIISKAKKLEKEFDSSKIDIAIACSGEITDLPAACKASRKLGIPLIHYAFDDYVNREIGIRRVWARAIERIYMKYVERTIVTNEFEEMDYRERGYTNTMIVRNPSPVEKIIECSRNLKKVGNDPFQIIYTGSIYSAHYDSFKRLILAMELAESDWNLHIYTSISPEILAENGIVGSRVKILPYVRRVEAILAMIRSDALFLPLAFESQYPEVIRSSSPGKIGDYLSSGTPVLVHAPSDSYVAKLFIDNNCGIVIDVPDAIAISKALHKLASDLRNNEVLSRNSRMTATNEFAREVNFERFAKAIELAFDS